MEALLTTPPSPGRAVPYVGNSLRAEPAGVYVKGCRLGAVCRLRCRDSPLLAAARRSRERRWRGFLGFLVSCQ